ncbi:hypothetical protein IFM89_033456 [Coptis chinensis]|uniref:DUF7731 domain-containing protein n=1 Tax=Coptis chinensis TaxID=261450 RepID=A0A835HYN0_9MAGN|nr:hypothetical protein IFM89_033456 [Coptis chinensis]
MAFSFNPKALFFCVILVSYAISCSKSESADDEEYGPAQIVSRALLCLNDNYIYKNCDESYRLTQSGNINVSPQETDQFCNGPCLAESNHVLNCIRDIFSNFCFYNRATIRDIRDTLKAGCSYTGKRGNFDVAEHMESGAWKVLHLTYMYLLITIGCILVLWNQY